MTTTTTGRSTTAARLYRLPFAKYAAQIGCNTH